MLQLLCFLLLALYILFIILGGIKGAWFRIICQVTECPNVIGCWSIKFAPCVLSLIDKCSLGVMVTHTVGKKV